MERFNSEIILSQIRSLSKKGNLAHETLPIERCLDRGRDSVVYALYESGLVAKFYTEADWPKDPSVFYYLDQYRRITNKAHELSLINDWKIFTGDFKQLPLRVNPYCDLVWSEDSKCWVGFCPFVSGQKANSFEFSEHFNDREYSYFRKEIGRIINKETNISGVEMDLVNVRFVKNGLYPQGCIVVTDLCINIRDLKIN